MKHPLRNLLIAAAGLALLAAFGGPWFAFGAIRSAADANDVAGLQRLIDFQAVRQSLRPQLAGDPVALAPPPSFLEDPLGAIRRQVQQAAPMAPRPDPDRYLTPAAIGALTRGEGRRASARTAAPDYNQRRNPAGKPIYWGVNDARIAVKDEAGARTVFSFQRRGPFEWKLTHIGLPPETVSSPASRRAAQP